MTPRPPETLDLSEGGIDAAIERAPDAGAVFMVWPEAGEPYLARTTLLRRRLRRLLGDRPGGRMLNLRALARRVDYWRTASRLETQLTLYALARQYFPENYSKLLKLRLPTYIKLILSNPFPRTSLTTRVNDGKSKFFGPFRTRATAEQFEARTLDLFQVRRCQEDLRPSPEHPGCIYGEMFKCLRPCQEAVGVEEYGSEAARLAGFFASSGVSLLEPVAKARERASEAMEFENAARHHKRYESILEVVNTRDDLAGDARSLCGVAVCASPVPNAVELAFVAQGLWRAQVTFPLMAPGSRMVPMDARLKEIAASITPARPAAHEREEHLAILARWYYSTWRDGEWIRFDTLEDPPYRRIVRAISRIATGKE
ncbi:MAG: hypothetical protein FJW40_06785 [Acidobacteria bacterium]|nr:hypothetical protein [Acidobacteriota bacterium]